MRRVLPAAFLTSILGGWVKDGNFGGVVRKDSLSLGDSGMRNVSGCGDETKI